MGNAASNILLIYPEDDTTVKQKVSVVGSRWLYCSDSDRIPFSHHRDYETKTEASFLQQRCSQEQKSMVDMSEVTTFLVFQAEDLLREEENHMITREDIQPGSAFQKPTDQKVHGSDGINRLQHQHDASTESVMPFDEASNAMNTASQEVRQSPSDDQSDSNSLRMIRKTKQSEQRWKEQERRDRGRRTARSLRMNENLLCGAFGCLEDPDRLEYLEKIRGHASSLYIHMPSQCTPYFHSNLARLMSEKDLIVSMAASLTNSTTIMTGCCSRLDTSFAMEPTPEADPPSRPISLLVSGVSFMDLAITGSLGFVKSSSKRRHSSGVHHRPPGRFIVLLNRRTGEPVAVCAKEIATDSDDSETPNVRIFSTSQRTFGQPHAATTRQLGLDWSTPSLPLYSWAEIVTRGSYPDPVTYTIFMATGSDGMFEALPSFKATLDPSSSTEILVSQWNDRTESYTGCAVLSLSKNDNATKEEDAVFVRLAILRGIDPALMVCLAAIVDEAMARVLQQQFTWLKAQYQV